MAIDQRMLAEYLRKQQQQGMSIARPPITMESQVNALANQPLAPGMVSAYVDESKPDPRAKSFAGEENRIKSQRAYADMLRGKEAPKGKTVGPYDLYMGPNWGESLAYAGEQALGGYMTGLANRDDKALDEEKGRVLAATLAAEDEEKARKAALEQAKLEVEEKTLAERIANNTRSNLTTIRGQDMTQANAEAVQAGQFGRNTQEYVALNDDGTPNYNKTRIAYNSPDGFRWGAMYGKELVNEDGWALRDDPNLTAQTTSESRGTASQKVNQYRANTFGDALDRIKTTMNEGGYDPTTGRAFIDKYANQNDLFRWASTEGGQKYNSDASTLKEAALRTSTGAAAPVQENSEYMTTLIPGPWDTEGTKVFKMAKLESIHARLLELSGLEGTTQADLDAEADRLIDDARREKTAIDTAETKVNGEEWEDATHRYRLFNGELQSERK